MKNLLPLGLTFILLSFQPLELRAEDELTDQIITSKNSILSELPAFMRNKLSEYAKMVGLESYEYDYGGENAGFRAYNVFLIENNKCFADLASRFYTDVAEKELEHIRMQEVYNGSYVGLYSLARSTTNSPEEAGWVWDLALSHTNNDPNLAMSLIGICGHDNVEQLPSTYERINCQETVVNQDGITTYTTESCDDVDTPYPLILQRDISRFMNYKREYVTQVDRVWQPTVQDQIISKELFFESSDSEKEDDSMISGANCPMLFSSFFTQGSLGESTLLSDTVLEEIETAQAPNMGLKVLPSKYYHTINAATMTCALVRNGVPKLMVPKVQSALINNYRFQRLCEGQNEVYLPEASVNELIELTKAYIEDNSICVDEIYEDGFKSFKPGNCSFLEDFQNQIDAESLSIEELKKNFERRFAVSDAYKILKESEIVNGPNCSRLHKTKKTINKIESTFSEDSSCFDLEANKCNLAKGVIHSWSSFQMFGMNKLT